MYKGNKYNMVLFPVMYRSYFFKSICRKFTLYSYTCRHSNLYWCYPRTSFQLCFVAICEPLVFMAYRPDLHSIQVISVTENWFASVLIVLGHVTFYTNLSHWTMCSMRLCTRVVLRMLFYMVPCKSTENIFSITQTTFKF